MRPRAALFGRDRNGVITSEMQAVEAGVVSRIWLYSNQAMVVRVVERRLHDQEWFVEADGPAELRGQHRFADAAGSAACLGRIDRQLSACGFACLWRSEERRSEPARSAPAVPPSRGAWVGGVAYTMRSLWSERRLRRQRPCVGLLSEDWLAAHVYLS
jgi:hypothetical protein